MYNVSHTNRRLSSSSNIALGDEEHAQISQPSLAAYRVPSFGYAFLSEIPIPELEDPRRRASLSKSSISSQYHHRERSLSEQSRRRPSSPPPSFVSSPEYSHSRTASWIGDNKFHFVEDVKLDGNTTPDRQKYMLRLARALISYGAPAHRLEEYMQESAEALCIGGQFIYVPGCMICSFNDTPNTKEDETAEVKIVRQSEGENYEKIDAVRMVYKEVRRGYISAETGSRKLDTIMERPNQNNYAVRIFSYGLAAASIGPLAYESRLIDLPVQFVLGLITGVLEIIVNQWMPFSVLFEVASPVITTFLARALGSINGGNTFCFASLAQTALVIILPGISITNAMLEMQSKSVVSGSIRTIKVMLFILFISLGMSIGSAAYGVLDPNAVTSAKCQNFDLQPKYYQFIAATTGGLAFVLEKQIKWSQAPAAVLIALLGFSASFLSSVWLPKLPQFGNIIASATIGVLGNLYSRLGYGVAAGVVIPGLTVLVPGSFSVASALLVGINNADISQNTTRLSDLGNRFGNKLTLDDNLRNDMSRVIVTAGISMIQLGIALAVGLFIANLLVYPVARKRKGLFGY